MRRPGAFSTVLLLVVLASACGGSSSTATTGGSAPASTDEVVDESAADTAQAPVADGTVDAVTISEAIYNAGSAHIEVSGGRQLTLDGQLLAGASATAGGTTLLMYPAGEGENSAVLSISNGADTGLAFTLTAPDITTGGDATNGCAIELTRNDASGLAGQFDCRGLLSIAPDMPTVDVRGTFSAEP